MTVVDVSANGQGTVDLDCRVRWVVHAERFGEPVGQVILVDRRFTEEGGVAGVVSIAVDRIREREKADVAAEQRGGHSLLRATTGDDAIRGETPACMEMLGKGREWHGGVRLGAEDDRYLCPQSGLSHPRHRTATGERNVVAVRGNK